MTQLQDFRNLDKPSIWASINPLSDSDGFRHEPLHTLSADQCLQEHAELTGGDGSRVPTPSLDHPAITSADPLRHSHRRSQRMPTSSPMQPAKHNAVQEAIERSLPDVGLGPDLAGPLLSAADTAAC